MDYWFLGHLILWGCSLLIAFVCLRRLLTLLKPLRNVYYYKLYQLDLRPADVRRVTVWQSSRRLVHAVGMCTYSDLQFDLPPALHAYLWVCFLVTALVANYMCSLIFLAEDSFRPEVGAALGGGCSLLCIALVLTLESIYVSSLNQNNKTNTVTQYGLDLANVSTVVQKAPAGARQEVTETNNASTRRQTGIERKDMHELTFRMNAVEVSSDSLLPGESPSYSAAKTPRPVLELSVLFLFVCIGVAAVWGTYVIVLRADVRLENCLMMWLVSVGADFPVRVVIAVLLGKTGLMRNFARDYATLDYGLRASDLGRFSPVPREESVMSPTAQTNLLPAGFQQEVEITPENTIEPLHYQSQASEESPRSYLQPPTLGNSHRESLTPDSPRELPDIEPLRNPFQLPEAPQKPASPSEASPEGSPVAAQTPPELQHLFKGVVRSPKALGHLPAPGLPTSPPKVPVPSPRHIEPNSFSLQEPAPESHAPAVIPAPETQPEALVSEDQKQPSQPESHSQPVHPAPQNYLEPALPVPDSHAELVPQSPAHTHLPAFEDQPVLPAPENHAQVVLPEPERQDNLSASESQPKLILPAPESPVERPLPESRPQSVLSVPESHLPAPVPGSLSLPVLPAPPLESHSLPVLPASSPENHPLPVLPEPSRGGLAQPASLPSGDEIEPRRSLSSEASVSLPAHIEPSLQTPRTPEVKPETSPPELPSDEEPSSEQQAAALRPGSSESPQVQERTDLTTPQRIELSRLSLQEDSDHSPKESEAESLQESVEELPKSESESEESIPEVIVVQYSSRPNRRRKQGSEDDSRESFEESKEPLQNALVADEEVQTRPVSALISLSGSDESKSREVAVKQRQVVKTPPEPSARRVAFPDPFPVPREEDQYSDILSTGRRTRAAFPAPPQHAQPVDILLEPEKPLVSQKPPRVARKDKPKKRRQRQVDEKHWSEGDDDAPPIIDSLVKPRQGKPALMKPHRSERPGSPEAAEAAPWRAPGDILYDDEDLPVAKGTHQFGFSAGQPLKLAQYEADVFNRVQSPTAANDTRVSFHTSETSTSRTIPPPVDPREVERRRIADELLRLSQSHSQLSEVDVDRLNEILDARVEFHRKYGYRPNDFESPYEEILHLREEEPSEIRKPVAVVASGAQKAAKLRSLYDRYKEGSSRPGKALNRHDSLPSFGIGPAPDMSKARRKLYQMVPSRSSANLPQHDLLNIQLPSSPIHEDPDDHSPRILAEVWR